MTQGQDHSKNMADNPEADTVKLLESKLPPYVVNYLKAAWFDNVDAICSMDVSEYHENSICEVENYICWTVLQYSSRYFCKPKWLRSA